MLFALLVGINEYHPDSTVSVPALSGCCNDIAALSDYLHTLYPPPQRQIQVLLNEKATYQEIVRGFGKEHLLGAQKGDVVVIAYSGHGSREPAAPEWTRYFGEGKQETWVCYDSRLANGLDLADKELAFLIEPIAQTGAHVVVIMDCCHSGSGTRYEGDSRILAPRQHSSRKQPRLWESYLNGALDQRFPKGQSAYLPNSQHILLAACDRREKAWEVMRDKAHGLFSSSYFPVLEATGGNISYADLFLATRAEMLKITNEQHPQFEAYGFFNPYSGFLGRMEAQTGSAAKIYFDNGQWIVTRGALHRLPLDQPSIFNITGQAAGARAVTGAVGAEESSVYLENFDADTARRYDVHLASLPVPPYIIDLKADEPWRKEVLQAVEKFETVRFCLRAHAGHTDYRIEANEQAISLWRTTDGLLIQKATGDNRPAMMQHIFSCAEHVTRWEEIVALDNTTSQIRPEHIAFTLSLLDEEGNVIQRSQQPEIILDIFDNQKIRFQVEVENKHEVQDLHCALFYASSSYAHSNAGFNECVKRGTSTVAWDRTDKGQPLTFQLNGKNSALDTLRLIVSQQKLTLATIALLPIKLGTEKVFANDRSDGTLTRSKDIGGGSADFGDENERLDQWNVFTLKVRNVACVKVGEEPALLAQGAVTVLPHPVFRANASVSPAGAAGGYREPATLLLEEARYKGWPVASFAPPQPVEAPLCVLSFSAVENEQALAEQPLLLRIKVKDIPPATSGKVWALEGENAKEIGVLTPSAEGWEAAIAHLPAVQSRGRMVAQLIFVFSPTP